ncbi:protein misato homolog 1 [Pseudophryne corroboree]|uniref:protein misato homolog 1 n=1 Tax=Pseudophryne corroboree TaxID=495146 RepID=UPI0030819E8F
MSVPSMSMMHLAESINFSGRKVLAASCSVPFPLLSSSLLPDALLPHLGSAPWHSVSACADDGTIFSQSVVLRGIPKERQSCRLLPGTRERSSLHACGSGDEVLQRYLSALYPRTVSFSHLLQTPSSLGPTFPQFFSPYVTKDGFSGEEPRPLAAVVDGVPVMAALQASSALHQSLRSLCDQVTQQDIRRWVNVEASGVEEEDFKESVSELRRLADCYRTRNDETDDDSD